MKRITNISLVLVLCCGISHFVPAQGIGSAGVTLDEFAKLGEELDYSKTRKKIVIKESGGEKLPKEFKLDKQPGHGSFSSLLAFIVVGILVGLIIFVVFSKVKIEKEIKPVVDDETQLDELEAINTDEGFATAIQTGDYRLAIRMQFLKVLQYLSENQYISWEPDKTNSHYLGELRQTGFYLLVRQLAHIYEVVWYGHTTIDEGEFRRINPLFEEFFKVQT